MRRPDAPDERRAAKEAGRRCNYARDLAKEFPSITLPPCMLHILGKSRYAGRFRVND